MLYIITFSFGSFNKNKVKFSSKKLVSYFLEDYSIKIHLKLVILKNYFIITYFFRNICPDSSKKSFM